VKALRRWIEVVIEPRRVLGLVGLPRYFADWWRLRRAGMPIRLRDSWPQLADRASNTPFDPHYYFQGAWLARQLAAAHPAAHIDVGSDLRLIGAVSAFVPTRFIDLRPAAIDMPGLHAMDGDATALMIDDASVPSLSCLHVIEHIGLGRYGDPLDPGGSEKACREFVRVLAPGGRLYLSTPVGRPRVEFNAHRIFAPESVLRMVEPLRLRSFAWVDDDGRYHTDATPQDAANARYACGLFEFEVAGPAHG